MNAAIATGTAEMIAEMKKPRLMAAMPERSLARGDTANADWRSGTPMAG